MRLLLKMDSVLEFTNVFVSNLIQNVFSSIKLLCVFLAIRKGSVKLCVKFDGLVQMFRYVTGLFYNSSAPNMIPNHLSFLFIA